MSKHLSDKMPVNSNSSQESPGGTLFVVAFVLLSLLGACYYWADNAAVSSARAKAERELSAVLNTTHLSIRSWRQKELAAIKTWSSSPRASLFASELLRSASDPELLLASPLHTNLKRFLTPALEIGRYQGFLLLSRTGTILSSSELGEIGTRVRRDETDSFIDEVFDRGSSITHPYRSSAPLKNEDGEIESNPITMLSGARVPDLSGEPIALLAFKINPRVEYAAGLQATWVGESGETYIFDRTGRLVSNSRFTAQLRRKGLLKTGETALLNLKLNLPGSSELTRMARSATSGKSGVDTVGYTNYLGEEVVGTWLWNERQGIGIASEISTTEEYEQLRLTRIALAVFAALAAMLIIALAGYSAINQRRLIAGRQRFFDFSSSVSDWFWETDENLKFTFISQQAEHIYQVPVERLLGRGYCDLCGLARDALPERLEQHSRQLDEHRPFRNFECPGLHIGETTRYLTMSGVPVFSASGRFQGYRGTGSDISVRKRHEQELARHRKGLEHLVEERTQTIRELEERSRNILDSAGQGIFGLDNEGKVTFINPMAGTMLGYKEEELLGNTVHELIHHSRPDGTPYPIDECLMHRAIGEGSAWAADNEVFWMKGGEKLPVEYVCTPMSDSGEGSGAVIIFNDISHRLQTEEALKKLSQAVESSPLSIVITDADGTIEYVNPHFTKLTGYTSAEALGQNPRVLKSGKMDPQVYVELWQTITAGKVWAGELHNRDKHGVEFWERCSIAPIRDREGQITHFVAVKEDITARKAAGEALRDSEERLKEAQELSHIGNWVLDYSIGRMSWSDEAFRIFGFSPQEFQPDLDTLFKTIHPSDLANVQDELTDISPQRQTFQVSHRIIRPDSEIRDLIENCRVSFDEAGAPTSLLATVLDVTERNQAEAALNTAKNEAEEASKAKSDFLANMSHEIRTPMNGVIGMTDLALQTDLTKEQREYLTLVKSSADALLEIIDSILDLSKIEAGKIELEEIDFDVRSCVENVASLLAVKALDKGIELICHLKPEVPTRLVGDPTRLRQILINLAGNAIKFTEQGEVVIRVESLYADAKTAKLKFCVEDSGIGIATDKLDAIFESFSQADTSTTRKYGGTGLGLAISKELVGLMDGKIWVESLEGHGTTFYFTVTMGIGKGAQETKVRSPEAIIERKPHVLIVDDNATNRIVAREIVSTWGVVAQEARNGYEALAAMTAARDEEKPFDLVMLDYLMPEMDGIEVAERIRAQASSEETRILILTSAVDKDVRIKFEQVGIDGYLQKPIRQAELIEAVTEILFAADAVADGLQGEHSTGTTRPLQILLAEDNPINQKVAISILKGRGHEVALAENGQEAIDRFGNGGFDLILMDVSMPVMNGLDATRKIRALEKSTQHTPIIALTANAIKGDREKCLEAGMDGYVSKPVRADELFSLIDELCSDSVVEQAAAPPEEAAQDLEGEIFNYTSALEIVAHDEELFIEVAKMFLEDVDEELSRIAELAAGDDTVALKEAAHKMKGSLGNLGAERAREAAHRLQIIGESGATEQAAAGVSILQEETLAFCQELRRKIG